MKTERIGVRVLAALLLILSLAFTGCVAFGTSDEVTPTRGPLDTATMPAGTEAATASAATTPLTEAATAPAATTGEAEPGLVERLAARDEIPAFMKSVLETMHLYYQNCYVGTLGTDEEMAASITELYLKYRNLIDEGDPGEVTDLLAECYLAAAGDKYAYYMNPEALAEYNSDISGNYVGIGVQVTNDSVSRKILITAVFPDTPAIEAGVVPGDTIEAVGDVPVGELTFAEVVNRIRGEEGTDVTVTFGRGDGTYTVTMTRRSVVQVTASAKIREGAPKIGVFRISEFDKTTEAQFKAALDALLEEGAEGIVFDVRDNPGGLLSAILAILDYLVPNGTPLASYLYYDGTTNATKATDGHEISPTLPISVICSAHTASAGELFTCALQDYAREGLLNVTVVGSVTFGKGTMQTGIELPEGRATTISIAYYNPPFSENYEGVGVIPDMIVELSEEAQQKSLYVLTEEEDTQMQAAIASVISRIPPEADE